MSIAPVKYIIYNFTPQKINASRIPRTGVGFVASCRPLFSDYWVAPLKGLAHTYIPQQQDSARSRTWSWEAYRLSWVTPPWAWLPIPHLQGYYSILGRPCQEFLQNILYIISGSQKIALWVTFAKKFRRLGEFKQKTGRGIHSRPANRNNILYIICKCKRNAKIYYI